MASFLLPMRRHGCDRHEPTLKPLSKAGQNTNPGSQRSLQCRRVHRLGPTLACCVFPVVAACCLLAKNDHREHRARYCPAFSIGDPAVRAAASLARKSVGVGAEARTARYCSHVHDNPNDLWTVDRASRPEFSRAIEIRKRVDSNARFDPRPRAVLISSQKAGRGPIRVLDSTLLHGLGPKRVPLVHLNWPS